MRLVAMDGPVSRIVRLELKRSHLPDGTIHCNFGPARFWPRPTSIRARNLEIITVHMDRVIGHRQVTKTNTDLFTFATHEMVQPWKNPTIPAPDIKIEHRIDFGYIRTRRNIKCIDQKNKVAINTHEIWVFWMNHKKAHHAHGHLHHFIGMRVVHERAALLELELIDERLAGFDMRLCQSTDAIHAAR